jgi:peptidoglycan hydrolase CwlO-like protein
MVLQEISGGPMKYLIPAGSIIIVILLVATFFPFKTLAEKIISDMVKRENQQIMQNYEDRLDTYEKEISVLQKSLKASDKKIIQLTKKIQEKENAIISNKPPQGIKEIIVRLNALGFHPTTCTCR